MSKTKLTPLTVPKLDFKEAAEETCSFIKKIVSGAGAGGVVVGLSGGVDSSLVATLCVRALGKDKVLGVLMPVSFTPSQDMEDARELAKWLEIRTEFVNVQPISEAFFKELAIDQKGLKQRMPMANIRARIRMIVLYYYANANNYLVVGTGDRSEDLIGFFTKYGDGGVDFLPISHLYKTHVRELAKYLGIPDKVAYKPSSPQLYPCHKATDEIPIDYEILDLILVGLFDYKLTPEQVSQITKVPIDVTKETIHRYDISKHKRAYPAMLKEW